MTATVGNWQDSPAQLFVQGLYEESSTKKHRLGTVRELDDGRKYVYCSATAAAITAGACLSKAQAIQACTVAAADALVNLAGVKTITLTLSGTPTAGLYEDGYLVLTAGTGIGQGYRIRGNTADDIPASGRCTFHLYEPLATAHLASDTTISIYQNPYKSLLLNPAVADENATTQETVMGVTIRAITASYYFWAQTWGPGSLVLDVAAACGAEANEMLIVQGATAGRGGLVIPLETTFFWGTQILGTTFISADHTNSEASLVNFSIS